MDRNPARANRTGDRIDQERHVVIDDCKMHPAVPGLAPARGKLDRDVARLAPGRDARDECRRCILFGVGKAVEFAR